MAVSRVLSVSRRLLSRTLSSHLHTPAWGASALKAQTVQGVSIGRVALSVSRHMYEAIRDQTKVMGLEATVLKAYMSPRCHVRGHRTSPFDLTQ